MTRQEKYPDTDVFHFYNANPKNRITTDCVVRAVCTATGKSWEDTTRELVEFAIKNSEDYGNSKCFGKYLEANGFIKRSQPRKRDGTKLTGKEFCELLKEDHKPIVANIGGNHTVCIKEKRIYDTWNSSGGRIGNYWIAK